MELIGNGSVDRARSSAVYTFCDLEPIIRALLNSLVCECPSDKCLVNCVIQGYLFLLCVFGHKTHHKRAQQCAFVILNDLLQCQR